MSVTYCITMYHTLMLEHITVTYYTAIYHNVILFTYITKIKVQCITL